MSSTPHETSSREEPVNAAISAWLEAAERGAAPESEEFIGRYPEFASELRAFFADHARMQGLAADFSPSSSPVRQLDTRSALDAAAQSSDSIQAGDAPTMAPLPVGSATDAALPLSGIGSRQFNDHFLLDEIARGGMGVVFRARDTGIGREVAVKVLLERHEGETALLQRFVEEAQIAGQLQHPGVTPVYEMGQLPDRRPYFTMKLVKGETLSRLLKDRPDPAHDRQRFLKIFEQVCQTLAYAHSRRVIHRDLKPANIMVGAFGEVQVMDWGLGKVLGDGASQAEPSPPAAPLHVSVVRTTRSTAAGDAGGSSSQTQTGSVLGTPAYMPPEQAMGHNDYLDRRADVFGLGAILCEILTGRPPYTGSDAWEVHFKAIRGDLTEAIERLDRCGADVQLIDLARHALAAEPKNRPADAGIVANQMTAYLEGVETRLRQAELAEVQAETRAIEERRRRKQTVVLGGAVLAALVIGVIGTSWGLIRAGRALEDEARQRKLAEDSQRSAHAAAESERRAKETVRRELYVADLELAGQVWESGNGTAKNVDGLLSGHIPLGGETDLREFAWRLQWTALHRNSGILKGHDLGARLVAFAPGGKLVTLDGDLALRHWELPTGKSLRSEMIRDAQHVSCWAISADARFIALGATERVHVFDAQTGDRIGTRGGHALVLALGFSSDGGKLAAIWGDGAAQIWDAASGEQTAALRLAEIANLPDLEGLALTPDCRSLLVIGYPENHQITWLGTDQAESPGKTGDRKSGGRQSEIRPSGHQSTVYSIALTQDGQLAATGDSNGQVCLWNTATREQIGAGLWIHRGNVKALQFSPDANGLATGGEDGVVTLWDVTRREPLHSLKGHLGPIHGLSFSPDGQSLASASGDGDVRVWNLASTGQSRLIGVHELPVFSMAWSPDGRRLAVGTGDGSMATDGIVKIWEAASGESARESANESANEITREIRTGKGRVLGLAYSADGRTLAAGAYDSYVRLWDPDSGRSLGELPGLPTDSTHFTRTAIGTLAISPDGTMIAAGFGSPSFHQSDYNQEFKVWDLASGRELIQRAGHVNTICSVAFSPDGQVLATASDDHEVKLWSVGDWQVIRTLSGTERCKSVAFSPDGKWVVAGGEIGAITVWAAASGSEVRRLTGHANAVPRLAFSRDGRTLASASWDGTVKLWDPISGRETRTLRGHTNWISCLAFSPDGNRLATGSFDRTVRLWEAASAEEIAVTIAADRANDERREQRHYVRQQQRSAGGVFPITPAVLDQCAGIYEGGLTVERRDEHLTIHPIQGAQGAAVALYAQSEGEFVCRDREIDVTFLKDDEGRVSRIIVYQSDQAFEAKKQEEASPRSRGD